MRLDKICLSDKYQTKIPFMKYHAMILHECANLQQNQKCATGICECRNVRKIRLELRSLSVVKHGDSFFLLIIKQLEPFQAISPEHSLNRLDKYQTKIAKRGDLNALQTSSEFNLYAMNKIISTKIGIFPELQIILLARVLKGVDQDFQDCSHCDTLFT